MGRPANIPLALVLGIFLIVAACSSTRPVFYPNPHLDTVGQAQARADADACMAEAKAYGVKDGSGEKVGGRDVKGAAIGTTTSAVVAAIWSSDVGRGRRGRQRRGRQRRL